jgi:hypothetical protein
MLTERTLFPVDAEPPVPVVPRSGRDEMNLAEYPLALLADRVPKGQKTIQYVNPHGTLTITGSDAFGLPTAADTDVLIGLIQLTRVRNNFTDPKVNFTRYELLKLLGWPDESKYYRRIDESLNRWVGVMLHYDNTWWDNRTKRYLSAKLHIIETVIIDDERPGRRRKNALPFSSFTWNKTFIESCQADNLKRLDLDRYFAFRSAISKRMYRFLDKRFYIRDDWVFDLKEFAFEHVGLSRNYAGNAGKIKEKLQPALEELEEIEFLEPLPREERYQKNGREWTIRLVRSPADVLLEEEPVVEEPPPLARELVARGVTEATALELARQFPAEAIQAKVEVFDWLAQRKDPKVRVNPAGYLVDSVRKDYAPPKGFESPAQRARRLEAEREAQICASKAQRQKLDEETRAQAEREAIEKYWQSLTREQQEQLDADALAAADPGTWESYRNKPALARMYRTNLRHDRIRKLLKERERGARR